MAAAINTLDYVKETTVLNAERTYGIEQNRSLVRATCQSSKVISVGELLHFPVSQLVFFLSPFII